MELHLSAGSRFCCHDDKHAEFFLSVFFKLNRAPSRLVNRTFLPCLRNLARIEVEPWLIRFGELLSRG